MQGPLGFPCLVVEPFDGGEGTRPAQRATVRTVGDLPDATLTVLPEAIAVGRGCVAPYARHLPTLLFRPLRAVLSDSTACRRTRGEENEPGIPVSDKQGLSLCGFPSEVEKLCTLDDIPFVNKNLRGYQSGIVSRF